MSYLNGPRINFWGGGSTNVCTANNADSGIVDLVSASVITTETDQQIIDGLRQPTTQGGQPYFTGGGWNYYGDHQVAFMNATVSSAGQPGAVGTTDPIVGLPVYLLGSVDPVSGQGPLGGPVMVDLDPSSGQTTQIYVGGLQIGNENPILKVQYDTCCHSQFLGGRYNSQAPYATKAPFSTPGSVYANGTFQVAFPTSALVHTQASPTLNAILKAPGVIGIVVRFCMFESMPGLSTSELVQNYQNNENDSNPSLGRIIGTIGPWLTDEPATCPPGRLLQNQTLGAGFGMPAQGLAWLDQTNNRLTLDLSSALQGQAIRQQSTNNTGPIGPNVDYGDLQIGTTAGVLVSTPSLPSTYYLFGGVYDVALTAAQTAMLAANAITIASTNPPNALSIVEVPLRIYSNSRNIYLNEGPGAVTPMAIDLIVTQLGGPVQQDTNVNLATVASGTYENPGFITYAAQVTVLQGSSSVSFTVTDNGGPAGFLALNFSLDSTPTVTSYFVNFRKYLQEDYSQIIAAGNIPWATVYQECLRFYYVLFPAMSKRIPLNDQPTVQNVAPVILKRTSPAYRGTTMCMPLDRALSPSKVALLRAYVQQFVPNG